ncbi:MAG: GNAT family N-acetyltransferase [Candidatus Bathyarchaeota archaeon]|nr:GNAT family N-acetyltransferase [Candidatus Bathyarchaeota archaeon]
MAEHVPFAAFKHMHAWIYNLHIVPYYRRHGFGSKLLETAESWARDQGFDTVGLHVADFNTAARNLYESKGYQLVDTHNWSCFYANKNVRL